MMDFVCIIITNPPIVNYIGHEEQLNVHNPATIGPRY